MRRTSTIITASIATAATVLMLLLARFATRVSPAALESSKPSASENALPVPTPPPSTISTVPITELNNLQTQQMQVQRLEERIEEQENLLEELRSRLEQQEQENQLLTTRLNTYENTIDMLITQQEQVVGMQRDADKTQASLLWVGVGLVVVVLMGGALILIVLVVLIVAQTRNRSPSSQIVYTTEVPLSTPPYPQETFLPQPRRTRQVYPHDLFKSD
jgi:TolA-binding protein